MLKKRNKLGQYQYKPFKDATWSPVIFVISIMLVGQLIKYAYEPPKTPISPLGTHVMASEPTLTAPAVVDPTPEPSPEPPQAPKLPQTEVERIIYQYFGDDAPRAITMVNECENRGQDPRAVNWNRNGTWDAGIFQINQVHGYSQEHLFDVENNVKAAYKIFKQAGSKFTPWSCAKHAGDIPFYMKGAK